MGEATLAMVATDCAAAMSAGPPRPAVAIVPATTAATPAMVPTVFSVFEIRTSCHRGRRRRSYDARPPSTRSARQAARASLKSPLVKPVVFFTAKPIRSSPRRVTRFLRKLSESSVDRSTRAFWRS